MPLRLPRLDPRITRELKPQRRLIVLGLACSAAAAAVLGANGFFIKEILAAVEHEHPERLSALSLGIVAVFFVRYFLVRGQTFYLSEAATLLTARLRVRLFEKLQRLPMRYFNERRAGGIQSVLSNDVNVFQSSVMALREGIDGPLKAVFGFVAIFLIQWQLALISLAILPLMAAFIQRNSRKIKFAQADVQRDLAELSAMTQEQLQGTKIIKAFGAEESAVARFNQLVEQSVASHMRAVRRIATLRPMVELIGAVALALTVYSCGLLVARGELSVQDLGAFIFFLDYINQGVKNLGSLNQTVAQVQAAADRVYSEVLDVEEPMADSPDARALPEPRGRVEFRNVSYRYPDGTQALRSVSFVIEPGTSLALVGPSGAGKSTIADLLLRFDDPIDGQVLFDGVDIRELKTSWLRAQIGVVPQQTFLFAGSIEENLRLGAPEATPTHIRVATEEAHAAKFIDSLPNGLQTVLGERGVRLSGGEGQRLAIARALVRHPKVLLLDEATSNLDAESEKIVTEALDEAMKSRTCLFIAHRLTTAARATKIVVLSDGQVLEEGSHAELLAQNGVYAGMMRAFSSGVLDGRV